MKTALTTEDFEEELNDLLTQALESQIPLGTILGIVYTNYETIRAIFNYKTYELAKGKRQD